MKNYLVIVAALFILTLAGCVPLPVNAFTPFMQGAAAAQQANYADQQREAYVRRQLINNDIAYFNQTRDYRYLCHAAGLGSIESANYLRSQGVACRQ